MGQELIALLAAPGLHALALKLCKTLVLAAVCSKMYLFAGYWSQHINISSILCGNMQRCWQNEGVCFVYTVCDSL